MNQEQRKALTVFGLCAIPVIAYLIAPQFVAGLIWDAVNTAVAYWTES
jgi:hypothetical protein